MSLNDCVYRGPDLNNKLSNVLMRFRLHAFAMCADISSMYNMVRVPKDDRDALRFIWRRDVELEHYRMSRHIFGGSGVEAAQLSLFKSVSTALLIRQSRTPC